MSRHRLIAIAIAALVPLTGCELFSVETEIPELCIGFNDRLIPGVAGSMDFERSIVADPLQTLGAYIELDAEITSARASLHAKSGVSDLSFIDSIEVTLMGAEPGNQIAPLSLVSCTDFECASDTMDTTLVQTPPSGVMDAIKAGKVELQVRMAGDMPQQDWVVDIELCVSGKARAALSL